MLDTKIPDSPTSPSLISLNGFCERKAPCFLPRPSRENFCQAYVLVQGYILIFSTQTCKGDLLPVLCSHEGLDSDLLSTGFQGRTFDGSGFSAKGTLISASTVPHRGYAAENMHTNIILVTKMPVTRADHLLRVL